MTPIIGADWQGAVLGGFLFGLGFWIANTLWGLILGLVQRIIAAAARKDPPPA